jgi:phosphate starvation-inducible protein PhoH and related proteins
MMDVDRASGLVARGQIEVAPLAFMRGRTLNDCFVILDEAQNATSDQMRMFLTRLGYSSRAVVTGDVTQVDLPHGARSGLAEARGLLGGIEGIAFCQFTEVDVVRHPLVQRIIVAYDRRDAELKRAREAAREPPEGAAGGPRADEPEAPPDDAGTAGTKP